MKIALIGASGFIGQAILEEAASRQHQITAIARHINKIRDLPEVTPLSVDINDTKALAAAIKDHDAVIISVKYTSLHARPLIDTFKAIGVPRLLAVGGAGSLKVNGGVQIVDTADFPVEWKPEAVAARDFLMLLQDEKVLDWSYLSPSALIESGERTGKFRLGKDQLLTDARGDSRISTRDYAVALVDELEKPAHRRQRFTVGY